MDNLSDLNNHTILYMIITICILCQRDLVHFQSFSTKVNKFKFYFKIEFIACHSEFNTLKKVFLSVLAHNEEF